METATGLATLSRSTKHQSQCRKDQRNSHWRSRGTVCYWAGSTQGTHVPNSVLVSLSVHFTALLHSKSTATHHCLHAFFIQEKGTLYYLSHGQKLEHVSCSESGEMGDNAILT